MRISFRKITKSVVRFLEEKIKVQNPKLRLSITITLYLVAAIVLFGVLPFIFGIYLVLLINENVNNNKLKYGMAAVIVAIMFLIGIPWASATYGSNEPAVSSEAAKTESVTAEPVKQEAKPIIDVKTISVPEDIAFETTNKDDSSITKGQTKVQQEGANGKKEKTYKVTYTDGHETSRELVSENVTVAATNKIILNGTYVAPAATTPPTSTSQSTGSGYTNVDGNHVASPGSNPAGASARCKDGTYSYSQHRRGTCSGHGGVAEWF